MLRRLLPLALAVLLIVGGITAWVYQQLAASLPRADGQIPLAGLLAPVTVERDHLGVPTISAQSRIDITRALGFVHAQDRFFQMDLSRRRAAGELAELLGDSLLEADRRTRVHRFRARGRDILTGLPAASMAILDAYTEGVNAGLRELEAPPFEYFLLQSEPQPWTTEDILLVGYSMYFELNDEEGRRESARGLIQDLLGPEMLAFLAPLGTEWDAPVDGESVAPPPIPGPEVANLRSELAQDSPPSEDIERRAPDVPQGSNNWAVAGRLTAHGGAILANDMHLGLSVPNIWYRASLRYPDAAAPRGLRQVTGVTLPGTPLMVAGSNGQVAWGYTNTYGDWEDLVVLEIDSRDPAAYIAPDGPRKFIRHNETLRSKERLSDSLEVLDTIWGPVIDSDHQGRLRALRWIAHDSEAVSFDLLRVEGATDALAAVAAAQRVGAPPQNFVVADSSGRIAWTVMGPIPNRYGHDGRLPSSWADGSRGWDGWLPAAEYPRIIEPATGLLWTANSRVVGGEMMKKIGLGSYALGARAQQIRNDLVAMDNPTELDLLTIQLDDRALFLERWRELLLQVLSAESSISDSRRSELRELVTTWSGRASTDSASYRLVRAFRLFVAERALGALTAACERADKRFDFADLLQYEGPLWRLVSERPEHLLDARFDSWDELLLAAVDDTLAHFLAANEDLYSHTWGARNTTAIRHPLSYSLPFLGRLLDMPAEPLPGDANMPRFQAPSEGASQRMVVSPGREAQGIFHMPAGQSGHPLSPHYRDGHSAWIQGKPTSFLPGPTVHKLELLPADQSNR